MESAGIKHSQDLIDMKTENPAQKEIGKPICKVSLFAKIKEETRYQPQLVLSLGI